jgi:hypothetical protein
LLLVSVCVIVHDCTTSGESLFSTQRALAPLVTQVCALEVLMNVVAFGEHSNELAVDVWATRCAFLASGVDRSILFGAALVPGCAVFAAAPAVATSIAAAAIAPTAAGNAVRISSPQRSRFAAGGETAFSRFETGKPGAGIRAAGA